MRVSRLINHLKKCEGVDGDVTENLPPHVESNESTVSEMPQNDVTESDPLPVDSNGSTISEIPQNESSINDDLLRDSVSSTINAALNVAWGNDVFSSSRVSDVEPSDLMTRTMDLPQSSLSTQIFEGRENEGGYESKGI